MAWSSLQTSHIRSGSHLCVSTASSGISPGCTYNSRSISFHFHHSQPSYGDELKWPSTGMSNQFSPFRMKISGRSLVFLSISVSFLLFLLSVILLIFHYVLCPLPSFLSFIPLPTPYLMLPSPLLLLLLLLLYLLFLHFFSSLFLPTSKQ
jgi:hypothetical protein